MKVSVVTPSFNQSRFCEATLRSVLEQDYPSLEYIIIDGGSTDESVDIIHRYASRLNYWISEPDKGQADAINKGWRRATGEIVAYLNSDDTYCPGALVAVAECFQRHPEAGMVYGFCQVIDEDGRVIGRRQIPEMNLERILCWNPPLVQPAVFWRRSAIETVGLMNPQLHYTMDYDLFLRVAARFPTQRIPVFLANARRHATAKTAASPRRHVEEAQEVAGRFLEQHPEYAHLRDRAEASLLIRKAHVACLTGNYSNARQLARQAVRQFPHLRSQAVPVILKSLIPLRLANFLRALRHA